MAPRGLGGKEPDYDDDAEVPWLAGVAEERDASTAVSQRRLVGGIVVFLGLLAAIVGGLYAITARTREGGSSIAVAATPAEVPLIAADPGPYKVRPDDPGGMQVEGAGDTMYAAGEGANVGGELDPGALPEDPMARPGERGPQDLLPPAAGASEVAAIPPVGAAPRTLPKASAPAAPAVAPANTRFEPTARPQQGDDPRLRVDPTVQAAAPPAPLKRLPKPPAPVPGVAPVKASGSAALQLGAFSSSAKADAAWKDYTARFAYLGGLGKSVGKVERDGATLYRLRATGVADHATAVDLCARLKVAGEACLVAE